MKTAPLLKLSRVLDFSENIIRSSQSVSKVFLSPFSRVRDLMPLKIFSGILAGKQRQLVATFFRPFPSYCSSDPISTEGCNNDGIVAPVFLTTRLLKFTHAGNCWEIQLLTRNILHSINANSKVASFALSAMYFQYSDILDVLRTKQDASLPIDDFLFQPHIACPKSIHSCSV